MYERARNCYIELRDGTIKMIDPFTGTVVRVNKERSARLPTAPIVNTPIPPNFRCPFCPGNERMTTPEKKREVLTGDQYVVHQTMQPNSALNDPNWKFRLIPNLFEIVPFTYWTVNYGYVPTAGAKDWKQRYLSLPEGKAHVVSIVDDKLRRLGRKPQQVSEDEKLSMADGFFAGSHELIIANGHFRRGAQYEHELHSSGEFTPEEHFEYMRCTVEAIKDIYQENRYVKFVNVFQNWLRPAGASVEHLHKQLVGNDEWGETIEEYLNLVVQDRNVFNALGVNLHGYHNFIFAENAYAVAYAAIGKTNPAVVIFSKSKAGTPMDLTNEELRGFSDILHGCHAAMGPQLPNNEEWFYTPKGCEHNKIPFHVQLDWRLSVPAGLEYIARIYISPMGPTGVRDTMVNGLTALRERGRIAHFRIAMECPCDLNCLKYAEA